MKRISANLTYHLFALLLLSLVSAVPQASAQGTYAGNTTSLVGSEPNCTVPLPFCLGNIDGYVWFLSGQFTTTAAATTACNAAAASKCASLPGDHTVVSSSLASQYWINLIAADSLSKVLDYQKAQTGLAKVDAWRYGSSKPYVTITKSASGIITKTFGTGGIGNKGAACFVSCNRP